jgi:hypothetical protein
MKRCYEICGYWPEKIGTDGIRRHGVHIGAFVITDKGAAAAAAAVEAKYPGVRIDSVNTKGGREVIEL